MPTPADTQKPPSSSGGALSQPPAGRHTGTPCASSPPFIGFLANGDWSLARRTCGKSPLPMRYNEIRTHLALGKDAPLGRAVQRTITSGYDFRKAQD
jgi:hypothetical protein